MFRYAVFSAMGHTIFVVVGLLIYVMATRIGHQHRPPASAMGWVISIVAFPYVAVPLFLMFGSRKLARPQKHRRGTSAAVPAPEGGPPWATQVLESMELPRPVHNDLLEWHADGASALKSLMDLIDSAERSLDIGTFIFGNDAVGDAVVQAMLRCRARGVRVRFMIDAIGSMQTRSSTLRRLRKAGIRVRRFMPLWHNPRRGRLNLRNHRKVAIADGKHLWSGGRNLAEEYFHDIDGMPAWIDLSHVAHGPLAAQAAAQFDSDWRTANGRVRHADSHVNAPPGPESGAWAQWVATGPDHADDTIHELLLTSCYHAQKRIVLVTPYFVPDDALLDAWCMACRRGVQVSLIVPRKSNHRLADWARERALRQLCAAGAHVWLVPHMLHAKAVLIDDDVALSGSLNLDARSLFLNYEVMTAFYSEPQIRWLSDWCARMVGKSRPYVAHAPGVLRDVGEGLVRSVGFQL
ncbi:phospholipase D-like domain-containing protein [Diaphorobacter sp.]|uniref:phospholipase D-like domain-containing protein n=1 Tax=Diaphorobacter sp. TaxID=1934310 RepID=UPI0028AD1626|nr:phospholipase D-like domain-containing protein [Diaphorobacter sp.]